MLTRYLSGFSLQFMQGVLSLLSAYEVSMVAYTCREGKEASELFRRGIYQVYINRLFVPAPNYTIGNFYSRFCLCHCCGENPRVSVYSWSFLPKSQRDLSPYDSYPPLFDTMCGDCATDFLYDWFDSGESVCICSDFFLDIDDVLEEMAEDRDDGPREIYTTFSATIFKPFYYTKEQTSTYTCMYREKTLEECDYFYKCRGYRCTYCREDVVKGDRVFRVSEDDFMNPKIYHIECFFSKFAVWKHSSQMTIEEQTLPSIEVI